jgi:hypothetical protein
LHWQGEKPPRPDVAWILEKKLWLEIDVPANETVIATPRFPKLPEPCRKLWSDHVAERQTRMAGGSALYVSRKRAPFAEARHFQGIAVAGSRRFGERSHPVRAASNIAKQDQNDVRSNLTL